MTVATDADGDCFINIFSTSPEEASVENPYLAHMYAITDFLAIVWQVGSTCKLSQMSPIGGCK